MNIHPIFVHFPIALLTLYAILEIVRFKKITSKPEFIYIKSFLLIIGTLGALVAIQTGGLAKHLVQSERSIIEVHQTFALATTWIFSILLLNYLIILADIFFYIKITGSKHAELWNKIKIWRNKIFCAPVVVILALSGLICITITGALGGSIVYGQSGDPFTAFIYNLLFPTR